MQFFTFNKLWAYSCSLFLILLLCDCTAEDPLDRNEVLPEDDIAIGEQIDIAFLDHIDTIPDYNLLKESDHQDLYDYVYNLCYLIQNSPALSSPDNPKYPVSKPILRILKGVNKTGAFVSPGSYTYIHTGLLKALKHEAELIPILAHLINCSNNRFAVTKLENHFSTNFLLDLVIGGSINGNYASPSADIFAVIDHLENKPYSYAEVSQLDEASEQAICQLGYDIQAYSTFFANNMVNDLDWFQLFKRNMSNNTYATYLLDNVSDSITCNGTKYSEGYPQFRTLIP